MKLWLSAALAATLLPPVSAAETETEVQQEKPAAKQVVRIGAVDSRSKRVVFRNLSTYLNRNGFPSRHVLYPSYDALVEALSRGEIDIAWNSPISHAQFHVRNQCNSQTLAMREGDLNLHVALIAPASSEIKSLKDLAGKRVIVGRAKYQEGLLSTHFLKKAGVDLDRVRIVRLAEKDAGGKRADTSSHLLQALSAGRGDAAVVPINFWNRSTPWREKHPAVKMVWKSPSFNHCVFSAAQDFDATLGRRFTKLMTTLDAKDPLIAELNRLENTRKWVPGDSAGFEALVEALQEADHQQEKK